MVSILMVHLTSPQIFDQSRMIHSIRLETRVEVPREWLPLSPLPLNFLTNGRNLRRHPFVAHGTCNIYPNFPLLLCPRAAL